MNKLLLTLCLFISTLALAEQSTTVGNLTIKMQDNYNEWIKVYKDGKLVLEKKCTMMCAIFVVKSEAFNFRYEDGLVKSDGKAAFKLHPDNIEVFKTGWFNQNEVIGFVKSTTGATGLAGSQTIYTIDIESGEVSSLREEFDNYYK
jgi:hypothetical protein